MGKCSVAPHCRTKIQGAGLDPHLGGGEGRFRGGDGCLGIRGWRPVGLGIFKVGGVGSGSNLAPWILCSAVRAISKILGISEYWWVEWTSSPSISGSYGPGDMVPDSHTLFMWYYKLGASKNGYSMVCVQKTKAMGVKSRKVTFLRTITQ